MEEKTLVQKCLEGDQDAFGALVGKYKTKVFNLAFSLTRNRETAEDLAQEAFIKAYRALKSFRFQSEFGTWLYRIALNHIKDYMRSEGRYRKVPFEETIMEMGVQEDVVRDREEEQIAEQRRKIVLEGIHSLPEKYKVILSLRDIQGFSYSDISHILKISPGTVDSRLHRARKMLRKKIAPFFLEKGETDAV